MQLTRRAMLALGTGMLGPHILTAAAEASETAPKMQRSDRERMIEKAIPALDAFIREYVQANNAPGLSFGLADAAGMLHTAAYGYVDIAGRTPMNTTHLCEIGSITKSFAALIVLQLCEERKLDLSDPVLRHLPWLPLETPYGDVQVHHLLTHSGGIPDASLRPCAAGMRLKQTFKPGSQFHYSNWGYEVLGRLIEKVDKRSWPNALLERILVPLGMTSTAPVITSANRSRIAQSYVPLYDDRPYPRGGALVPAGNLVVTIPPGSVASTPADMARYMHMLIRRGAGPSLRLVSEESFKLFCTTYLPGEEEFGTPAGYGYGIAIDKLDGHTRIGHTGGMVSFASAMQIDMDAGIGAFASINALQGYRPNPVAQYALQLLRASADHLSTPIPPRMVSAIAEPRDYIGAYLSPEARRLEVYEANGALVLLVDEKRVNLEHLEGEQFVADLPGFDLYPIMFGRTAIDTRNSAGGRRCQVVELAYGSDSYVREGCTRLQKIEADPALVRFTGLYYSENPWVGTIRVVARQGQLWLDGVIPLDQRDGGIFSLADEKNSPEVAEFMCMVADRAQVLRLSGAELMRQPDWPSS